MQVLQKEFFQRDTVAVAKGLLGKMMVYDSPLGRVSGLIVEDEAYLGGNDPGSHSFRGKTKRNEVMFGPAGISYIYQIYGLYLCYNVTTERDEIPAAVLIRALQPVAGIELMKENRQKNGLTQLASGPGKLAQALGITKEMNGTCAVHGPVRFYECDLLEPFEIMETTRIGLTRGADLPLRFYIKGNKFISRK